MLMYFCVGCQFRIQNVVDKSTWNATVLRAKDVILSIVNATEQQ